jgi:mono/diheme cytochrome c family protein
MRFSPTVALPLLFIAASTSCAQGQDELLARGTYLVEGILACGNCHTPKSADAVPIAQMRFAGGFIIEEPGVKAYAPNITMDEATGIGTWSDEEIIRGIRDGLRPDGTLVGAILAYMRNVDPVRNVVPKSEYGIPLPDAWGPPVGEVADVSRDDPLAYGTYVTVTLGHCIECHTPMVQGILDLARTNEGGRVFENLFELDFTVISANVTPHPELGIGEWTDEEIKRAITQGISRDGREHLPAMAYPYYATINDEDLDAIVLYLRSLPPLPAD